jgi:hypothetical protein
MAESTLRNRVLVVAAGASFVGFGLGIAPSRERQSNWVRVARDSSYDIAIDTSRVLQHYGRVYTIWYRTDHGLTHLYKDKEFNREIVQSVLRCDGLSFKVASVDMAMNGRVVSSQRTSSGELGNQPWRRVEPGTTEAFAAKAACDVASRFAKPAPSRARFAERARFRTTSPAREASR